MSSIRPPKPPDGASQSGSVDGGHKSADAPTFREALGTAGSAPTSQIQGLTDLLTEYHSGAINREELMGRFVERALARPEFAGLSGSERDRLRTQLFSLMESDPTLIALVDDVEKT